MPSVIISRDSHLESVFALQAKTSIGRGPNNDILLPSPGVSRVHAYIEQQRNHFFLIDKGSTNGTFIENHRVEHHQLKNGTSFHIQDYLLTFVEDDQAPEENTDSIIAASLTDDVPDKMMETLMSTQDVLHKQDLHKKISRLLKMISDLLTAAGGSEPGALILDALFEIMGAQRGFVALKQKKGGLLFPNIRGFSDQEQRAAISRSILDQTLETGNVVFMRRAYTEAPTDSVYKLNLKSVLCVPLMEKDEAIGCIYLDHPGFSGVFTEIDRDLLVAAADFIAPAVLEIKGTANGLFGENERLSRNLNSKGIVARSPKTLKVFRDSQTIARYNISVLIFGETGTGKEVIAQFIHNQSGRRGKFIARNCSAIAPTMFESELFGHEKGAFTGATEQKQGLFELANQGTLFLDEIGDMPAELQAKVLRALQEGEVWRVGGSVPVKVDVRVIAATHKDIKKRRKQLNFRDDLYYRLANVEITAPSLKERPEDIGPLSEMILEKFGSEELDNKKCISLSPTALRLLEAYNWPGNIRELRNVLIQLSLKCDDTVIDTRHLKGLIDVFAAAPAKEAAAGPLPTLVEMERAHIIKALKITEWNKSAAAKILDIDRNRLHRYIKKYEIEEPGTA